MTLVDYYGVAMMSLFLGICELYVMGWVYGVNRLCKDVEFMIGRKVGLYWRMCWSVITPIIMTVILIYFLSTYAPLTYNNKTYSNGMYGELILLFIKRLSFNYFLNFSLWLDHNIDRGLTNTDMVVCRCYTRSWYNVAGQIF